MFNDLPNYLKSLQQSYQTSDIVTQQLISLITEVFNQNFQQRLVDVDGLGMAHLQSFEQLKMAMSTNGLENLAHTINETAMRHLFKLWITRNQDRGTYFLQAVLQVLFQSHVVINQVWHSKTLPYPFNPTFAGDPDGFLTSRIDVTIYSTINADINALKRIAAVILPARLVPTFYVGQCHATVIDNNPMPEYWTICE